MDFTDRITADVNILYGKGRTIIMSFLIIPEDYTPEIDFMESQRAIKKIKDFFQDELA